MRQQQFPECISLEMKTAVLSYLLYSRYNNVCLSVTEMWCGGNQTIKNTKY